MSEAQIRMRIRKVIIGMEKPFCIINLLVRLEEENITDQSLIMSVLEELYDAGIILYDEVEETVDDPNAPRWAFRVATAV